MSRVLVLFDFDQTLIDGDSDRWMVTEMGLTSLFNQLLPTSPWNSLMDRMMEELHCQGKTAEDIAMCLKRIPLDPQVISAIKSAHSLGCDLRIISDANRFFIETILEHHGLLGCFLQIYTNPTFVDAEGRLRICPYHDLESPPHACALCPSNMCKGLVVENLSKSALAKGNSRRIIYVGDGRGDICPTMKLGEYDYVMPRKDYPLYNHIHMNKTLVKAQVHDWSNGDELESILHRLLNDTLVLDDHINMSS